MKRKMSTLTIIVMVVAALTLAPSSPSGGQLGRSGVSMSLAHYRLYLENHSPLDVLYVQDEMIFLYVTAVEKAELTATGFPVGSEAVGSEVGFKGQSTAVDGNYNFHSYGTMTLDLLQLAAEHPDEAKVIVLGYSVQKRPIYALQISDHINQTNGKPNVYITGCHHAREWITVEVPLLFARYLLENRSRDVLAEQGVVNNNVFIIPCVNPDGFEYSWKTYRMWRKNRVYNGYLYWGVDLNRNYGYKWGFDNSGSSPYWYSDVFRGRSAFSEPETRAVRDFMTKNPPAAFLSYHNYSQLIIFPWGYTNIPAPDHSRLNLYAGEMARLIQDVSGRTYTYGNSDILYRTNGDSDDWVYGTFRVPTFTIELPPQYFFQGMFYNPIADIEPIFREQLPVMLYLVTTVAAQGFSDH